MHGLPTGLKGLIFVAGLTLRVLASPAEHRGSACAPIPGARDPVAPTFQLHGLNFSPYQAGQDPARDTVIGEAQLAARLRLVQPHTRWIRTYGSTQGLQPSGRIVRSLGLKTAIGAWLSADRAANAREITHLIAAIKAGDADLAIVGSEVLLRRDLGEAELIAYIEQVRRASGGAPVAYADVHGVWLAYPEVGAAVDVVLANYYPYWEGVPVERAVAALDDWHRQVTAAVGKPVGVGETGWPSGGDPVGAAVPSAENASRYLRDFLAWARANRVQYLYFAAFDEDWKAAREGPQGAHWGLWDQQERLKPGLAAVLVEATRVGDIPGGESPDPDGRPRIEFTAVPPYGGFRDLEMRPCRLYWKKRRWLVSRSDVNNYYH